MCATSAGTLLLPLAAGQRRCGAGQAADAAALAVLLQAARHASTEGYTRIQMHATTILCVRKDGQVRVYLTRHPPGMHARQRVVRGGPSRLPPGMRARRDKRPLWPLCVQVVLIGDGQVTMGSTMIKPNARKVRRIGDVIVGFAGVCALSAAASLIASRSQPVHSYSC